MPDPIVNSVLMMTIPIVLIILGWIGYRFIRFIFID